MSQETQSKSKVEIDYLTEDKPITGQEYGVYSFLTPEGIKGCNVRAFKNRGNFGSYEEASAYAEKIRNDEPAFHVFVGENFKWMPFDPDPNVIKDNNNYYEPKLQELMKGTLENQEKAKQLESQRKRDMIESAIKEEIKKKSEKKETTKDRLQRKVAERKKQSQSHEDEVVTNELEKMNKSSDMTDEQLLEKKEEVKKLGENISSIDENLDKMKKLYADLLNKKKSTASTNA
jgi:hypothetical protein